MQYRLSIYFLCAFSLIGCSTTPEKTLTGVELHKLCYSYSYGENGYTKSHEEAFKWCTVAAETNQPSSLTLLAELYTLGNGTDKNLIKAGELYENAAAQGHFHAQLMVYLVYNYYALDESTDKQKELGVEFLKSSKESGYQKAIDVYKQVFGQKI
jgi:TPR repeat protein